MENKYLTQNIDRLDISCDVLEILKKNNIRKIEELRKTNVTELRGMDLTTKEIEKINTELELLGLGLKGKI